MKRSHFWFLVFACAATACSGGGTLGPGAHISVASPSPVPSGGSAATATQIRFTVTIPADTKTSNRRRPQYISPNTASFSLNENDVRLATFSIGNASECSAQSGGATVCTVVIPANPGANQTFEVQAASSTGAILSAQTLVTTIYAGQSNALTFVLGGVPATLAVSISPLLQPGTAGSTLVNVNAFDASGAMIVGPGVFSDSDGNPVTVTLHADDSGHTQLASFAITQPESVKLTYDGAALPSYVGGITASLPGIPSQAIADFACGTPKTPEFLASTMSSNRYEIGRYPLAGNGTAMTSEPPLVDAGPYFSTDAAGDIYLYSLSDSNISVSEYCANANGLVGSPGTPVAANAAAPVAQYSYSLPTTFTPGQVPPFFSSITTAANGNRFTADYETPIGYVPKYAQIIINGYGQGNNRVFGPANASGGALGTEMTGFAVGSQDAYVGTSTFVTTLDLGSQASTLFQASPGFVLPIETATDGAGDLYALYGVNGNIGSMGQAGYSPSGITPAGIVEYASDGTIKRTISGSSAQIYPNTFAVAPDGTIFVTYGQFYVGSGSPPSGIAKFGPTQNGNVAPNVTIAQSGIVEGADSSDNVYLLQTSNVLGVYDSSGTMQRQVALPALSSISVAASGEIAYFSNDAIYTLPPGATAVSQGTPATAATNLPAGTIALDPKTGEIVYDEVANQDGVYGGSISVYNPTGTAMERFFSYATATGSARPVSVNAGNVFVIAGDDVEEFASTSQSAGGGTVAPSAGYDDYAVSSFVTSIGVDDSTGDVLVASCIPGAVGVYAPGLSGAPIRTIAGYKTTLASLPGTCPGSPSMDENGAIYVPFDGSILEFAPGANGNVAPVGIIAGSSSGAAGYATDGAARSIVSMVRRNGAYAKAMREELTGVASHPRN